MDYKLVKLNLNMGEKEYEMYQDIPALENGQVNLCNGLSFKVFKTYIESQMARQYQTVSKYDTPTIIYIMYVNNYPVGEIGLRTKINDEWKHWSGNFYYKIRKSERNKGYGNIILKLALEKLGNLNFREVYGQANKNNISSNKIIINNGGILIHENENCNFYKITL